MARKKIDSGAPSDGQSGKARYALLLWLIGVPLPIILLIWMVKGCV